MSSKFIKEKFLNVDYDTPWKTVIGNHFKEFILFFFPEAHKEIDWSRSYEFLDTQLAQVVRDAKLGKRFADKLVKVHRIGGAQLLVFIHIEVQGYVDTDFAKRMYTYNCRIFDKYAMPVASFAILADENKKWRPTCFEYAIWGCEVGLRFPTVKLLDYRKRWNELETSKNPYAIIIMSHLKALDTKKNNQERKQQRKELTKKLFKKGFGKKQIFELWEFIDWIMVLPKEMVKELNHEIKKEEPKMAAYISTTAKIWMKEGMEKGISKGEGILLITLLEKMFESSLPKWAIKKIEKADTSSLGKWGLRILRGGTLKEILA